MACSLILFSSFAVQKPQVTKYLHIQIIKLYGFKSTFFSMSVCEYKILVCSETYFQMYVIVRKADVIHRTIII